MAKHPNHEQPGRQAGRLGPRLCSRSRELWSGVEFRQEELRLGCSAGLWGHCKVR